MEVTLSLVTPGDAMSPGRSRTPGRPTMPPEPSAPATELSVTTASPEETFRLGEALAAHLRPGAVVALVGELAAGKTVFTKGLAVGLGVPDEDTVTSPAYDLVHEYRGRLAVHHVDLYRLDELTTEDRLWIEEYLHGDGVTVVEWADRFPEVLPEDRVEVTFDVPGPGRDDRPDRRVLRIEGRGAYRETVVRLRERGSP